MLKQYLKHNPTPTLQIMLVVKIYIVHITSIFGAGPSQDIHLFSTGHIEIVAGGKAFIVFYGSKKDTSLNSSHKMKFMDKISEKLIHVIHISLSPTSSTATYNSLCATVETWNLCHECGKLGPKVGKEEYASINIYLPPAPQELMQIISCGYHGHCSSNIYSRRKECREFTFVCSNWK